MHKFAVENLEKAKKYYHISADTSRVPDIDSLRDDELPGLMDMEDSRQVLHITYGLILTDRDAKGNSVFRDEIYQTLDSCEEAYYSAVEKHIGRHLKALGIK
jgi:5S rRNA maturation endonuclease (ribonuclease M5)